MKNKVMTTKEIFISVYAIIIAIVVNRLFAVQQLFWYFKPELLAIFWLVIIIGYYVCFWDKLKKDIVLWIVNTCNLLLVLWYISVTQTRFFQAGNSHFALISTIVIPCVFVAQSVWIVGGYNIKNTDGIIISWFRGVFIYPFSEISQPFRKILKLVSSSKNSGSVIKKISIGLFFAFMLLMVIIPLLMGADQVFDYYVRNIFSNFELDILIWNIVSIFVVFVISYSFFYNVRFDTIIKEPIIFVKENVDLIISATVLCSIIFVYILFSIVQFTYLFATIGLPAGITYAEYARTGFAQMLVVCAINLLLYAFFLRYTINNKVMTILLSVLSALTGLMLLSSWTRLSLYISEFGMTWLRLISAWFIIYMTVVVGLCCVRLFKKNLPLMFLSAIILLVWYVALGYLNPSSFIAWFNSY